MQIPSKIALRGCVCLLALTPLQAAQEIIWSSEGQATYENSGKALGTLEDLDGDGVRELILGAPGAKNALGQTVGAVRVLSGESGMLLHTIEGSQAYESFGSAIASGADCDGDGWDDFAITATGFDSATVANAGKVTLYSGRTLQVIRSWEGAEPNTEFGTALVFSGDLDGDGLTDLLCGAHRGASAGGNLNGQLFAWSGADGSLIYQLEGLTVGDHLGWAIATIGDTTGDSHPEFVVGAPYAGTSGEAFLVNGATGAILHTIVGAQNDDRWGRSVCASPDLDQDGLPDFIVGSPEATVNGVDDTGALQIYSSQSGLSIRQIEGATPGGFFAEQLALSSSQADFNGDFVADLVVGVPRSDPSGLNDAGLVQIWSLASPFVMHEFSGLEAGAKLGSACYALPASGARQRSRLWLSSPNATVSGLRQAGRTELWQFQLLPFLAASPLIAGGIATLELYRLEPFSEATFLASFAGNGPTNTPFGLVNLTPPFRVLPLQTIDATGVHEVQVLVSPHLQGLPVWLQGASRLQTGEILFSNPLASVIQ